MVSVEGGGELLVLGGIEKHVTGELLDRELIEGHVLAVGLDDPIAPWPVLTLAIVLIAIGISVAGDIEPVERHALGVGIGVEEEGDVVLVGVGRFVV